MRNKMITIMLMQDNKSLHSIRLYTFVYKSFCTIVILLPILLCLSIYACYYLWNDNIILNENALHIQNEANKAKALAENLAVFNVLLDEDHIINASIIKINKAKELNQKNLQSENVETQTEAKAEQEGPGHEEFPVIDTEEIILENIRARVLDDGKISISLDLRNPDISKTITGRVNCILSDATGATHPLEIEEGLKSFRINRFKRVVFMPDIDPALADEYISIIIEVFDDSDKVIYRNITPVEQ